MGAALKKPSFAPNPQRRALLAKVHIAPKQLGMDDDSYRVVLRRVTGQISAGDCSLVQLEALIAEFTRMGFSTVAAPRRAGAGKPVRRADHPVARKARAMWIALGYLCAIRDPAESALEAFACSQLGCSTLQWADQSQGDRLIEALKAIGGRHGWLPYLKGIAKVHHLSLQKSSLCAAILAKLKREGLALADWHLGEAAWRLCQISDPDQHSFTIEELDRIAPKLGALLRAKGGDGAFEKMA